MAPQKNPRVQCYLGRPNGVVDLEEYLGLDSQRTNPPKYAYTTEDLTVNDTFGVAELGDYLRSQPIILVQRPQRTNPPGLKTPQTSLQFQAGALSSTFSKRIIQKSNVEGWIELYINMTSSILCLGISSNINISQSYCLLSLQGLYTFSQSWPFASTEKTLQDNNPGNHSSNCGCKGLTVGLGPFSQLQALRSYGEHSPG